MRPRKKNRSRRSEQRSTGASVPQETSMPPIDEKTTHDVVLPTQQGMSRRAIARALKISRNTVREILADHGAARKSEHTALPTLAAQVRPTKLDAYRPRIEQLLVNYLVTRVTSRVSPDRVNASGREPGGSASVPGVPSLWARRLRRLLSLLVGDQVKDTDLPEGSRPPKRHPPSDLSWAHKRDPTCPRSIRRNQTIARSFMTIRGNVRITGLATRRLRARAGGTPPRSGRAPG